MSRTIRRCSMLSVLLWPLTLFHQGTLAAQQSADLVRQADEAFRSGHLTRADGLARQALSADSDSIHAHIILGTISAQQGQWKPATEHFKSVIRLAPSNPFGHFHLGQAYLYQKKWKPAAEEFSRALELGYADRDRLIIQLAYAENEAGASQEAINRLNSIREPARKLLAAQYHTIQAYGYRRLNQPEQAIRSIRRAIELDETNPEYRVVLITLLMETSQLNRALAESILAQKKFPDYPDIQFIFGVASYYVTESPFTKLAYRNLLEVEPSSPRVLLLEGLTHRKKGRIEEANHAFRLAAEQGVPDAHLLLGILLKEDGDYSGAEREFREAERLNPHNGQTFLELGKLLAIRQNLTEALERLQKAERYLPKNPVVHYQLGLVYARLGEPNKAKYHTDLFRKLDKALREQADPTSR